MSNARWLVGGALTLTLVANACSSDNGASSPGDGAAGEAGAAGEPSSNGGGSSAGHAGAEAGSAGAAPEEAAGASGAAGAPEAEAGAAGAPLSTGGSSSGGSGGTSGSGGTGGAPVVTCLPAGELDVTASASLTYMIDTQTDPTLVLCRGSKYTFNLDVSGHPFYIKTVDNSFGVDNAFSEGVVGNGNTTGTLVFTVPADAPATLYYHCAFHNGMGGKLTIID